VRARQADLPPSKMHLPTRLDLTRGSAFAVLVDAFAREEFEHKVRTGDRIPRNVRGSTLRPVHRVVGLYHQVVHGNHTVSNRRGKRRSPPVFVADVRGAHGKCPKVVRCRIVHRILPSCLTKIRDVAADPPPTVRRELDAIRRAPSRNEHAA
jgi:hypothetical protein